MIVQRVRRLVLAWLVVGVAVSLQGCTSSAEPTARSATSTTTTFVARTTAATAGPTADSGAASSSGLGQPCQPLPLVESTYFDADGRTLDPNATAADRKAAANKRVYLLPDGRKMSTIIPPAGFNPQTADVATAKAFGFTERERDGSYRRTIPSAPCASHVVH